MVIDNNKVCSSSPKMRDLWCQHVWSTLIAHEPRSHKVSNSYELVLCAPGAFQCRSVYKRHPQSSHTVLFTDKKLQLISDTPQLEGLESITKWLVFSDLHVNRLNFKVRPLSLVISLECSIMRNSLEHPLLHISHIFTLHETSRQDDTYVPAL